MKLTFLVSKGLLCLYSRNRVDYAVAYVPPPPPKVKRKRVQVYTNLTLIVYRDDTLIDNNINNIW